MCKSAPLTCSNEATVSGSFSLFNSLRKRLLSGKEPSIEEKNGQTAWSTGGQRAFDIADDLEAGFARELTQDLQHPLRRADKLWKFKVVRGEDRRQYRLYSEAGNFLLYAKVDLDSKFVEFHTYNPSDREQTSLFDAQRPAFTMTCNEAKNDWRLVEERCDYCTYLPQNRSCRCKRELAKIRQCQKKIGDGLFHCMEIDAAPLREDGCAAAMPACTGETQREPQRLVTRAPKWNSDLDSLVMDFKGRSVVSSAKNFQLAPADRPDHIVCQYAKIGTHVFGLDFRHPMSVIQVFGISLTTLMWT